MARGAVVRQFADRRDAGRQLADRLRRYAGRDDVVVLGLPRGGVPVAYEVALALAAPLGLMPVRKLGVPGQEELAFGAIASDGVCVFNPQVMADLQLTPEQIESVSAAERQELVRRERLYRCGLPAPALRDRIVLVVDDGLATGATMRAAIEAVRARHGRPVVAVPVGANSTVAAIGSVADGIFCLLTPARFVAVGNWYGDFAATTDQEVRELLAHARRRP